LQTVREDSNGKIPRAQATSGANRCLCPDVGGGHGNPRLVRTI
jgi:hypothetical protein